MADPDREQLRIPDVRRLTGGSSQAARLLAAAILAFSVIVVGAQPADAHPLGNFTINRYARLEVSAGQLRVYYVLDEAEIPAFQDRDQVKAGSEVFARTRTDQIRSNLHLVIDGSETVLRGEVPTLSQPKGQGGLTTLRLAQVMSAPLPLGAEQEHVATFRDDNEPDRIGWREIVVEARGNGRITSSNAPGHDVSDELLHYPGNLIQAPLQQRSVRFSFIPGSETVPPATIGQAVKAVSRAGGAFADLINRQRLTPWVLVGLLALAAGFGAAHALAPGHGKTIMAAYLVGTKGRPRDAFLLGGIVSVMHTASVLVLGIVLYEVNSSTATDRIFPWLKLGSGLAVTALGIGLLVNRARALGIFGGGADLTVQASPVRSRELPALVSTGAAGHERHVHDHAHDQHDHAHDQHDHTHDQHDHTHDQHDLTQHQHDHAHGHRPQDGDHRHGPGPFRHRHLHELPEGAAPFSRRGLVVLATTGGLFPSPSALIVLIAAFSLRRVGLGLGLIAAFSVGLAVTLTSVGLALVYGRNIVTRKGVVPALRLLPLVSAGAIVVLGGAFAVSGLRGLH